MGKKQVPGCKYAFRIMDDTGKPRGWWWVETLSGPKAAMKHAKQLAGNLHVLVNGQDGLDGCSDRTGSGWHNFPIGMVDHVPADE